MSQYYMVAKFKGTLVGNILKFEEIDFIENQPEPSGVWCLASGELTYQIENTQQKQSGTYVDKKTFPQCGYPGQITVIKQP